MGTLGATLNALPSSHTEVEAYPTLSGVMTVEAVPIVDGLLRRGLEALPEEFSPPATAA